MSEVTRESLFKSKIAAAKSWLGDLLEWDGIQKQSSYETFIVDKAMQLAELIDEDRKRQVAILSDSNLAHMLTELEHAGKDEEYQYNEFYRANLKLVEKSRKKAEAKMLKLLPEHSLIEKQEQGRKIVTSLESAPEKIVATIEQEINEELDKLGGIEETQMKLIDEAKTRYGFNECEIKKHIWGDIGIKIGDGKYAGVQIYVTRNNKIRGPLDTVKTAEKNFEAVKQRYIDYYKNRYKFTEYNVIDENPADETFALEFVDPSTQQKMRIAVDPTKEEIVAEDPQQPHIVEDTRKEGCEGPENTGYGGDRPGVMVSPLASATSTSSNSTANLTLINNPGNITLTVDSSTNTISLGATTVEIKNEMSQEQKDELKNNLIDFAKNEYGVEKEGQLTYQFDYEQIKKIGGEMEMSEDLLDEVVAELNYLAGSIIVNESRNSAQPELQSIDSKKAVLLKTVGKLVDGTVVNIIGQMENSVHFATLDNNTFGWIPQTHIQYVEKELATK